MSVSEVAERPPSARERLLAAADELFYAEGIHTVGIDRVIEHAGVAKATLYTTFGSKDELIRAYLLGRHELWRQRVHRHLAEEHSPRGRILGVFDALGELIASSHWRGCPLLAASGEARTDTTVREVAAAARAWTHQIFAGEAEALGVADPGILAERLLLLYDGARVAAYSQGEPSAASAARELAAMTIDTWVSSPGGCTSATQ